MKCKRCSGGNILVFDFVCVRRVSCSPMLNWKWDESDKGQKSRTRNVSFLPGCHRTSVRFLFNIDIYGIFINKNCIWMQFSHSSTIDIEVKDRFYLKYHNFDCRTFMTVFPFQIFGLWLLPHPKRVPLSLDIKNKGTRAHIYRPIHRSCFSFDHSDLQETFLNIMQLCNVFVYV